MLAFFHADGENRTSTGRISSLPAIIQNERTILLRLEKKKKKKIINKNHGQKKKRIIRKV
jgi:hypothetical protein